jgi:hypothetical protein
MRVPVACPPFQRITKMVGTARRVRLCPPYSLRKMQAVIPGMNAIAFTREVRASSASLEGWIQQRCLRPILRGSQELAPPATTAKPLRGDDGGVCECNGGHGAKSAPLPTLRPTPLRQTTASLRSIASSTRSSSWPRRRISPVAEITLYMPCLRASRGSFSMR